MPAKIAIGAAVVVAAGAGLAFALTGDHAPKPRAAAPKPAPIRIVPSPSPTPPKPTPPAPSPAPRSVAPAPTHPHPKPTPRPTPKPTPAPRPKPTPKPTPPPAPADYYADTLPYGGLTAQKQDQPAIDTWRSAPTWQRSSGIRIGGTSYDHGITVHAPARTVIDLNRSCRSFNAVAGVDDMTLGLGSVRLSVLDAASGRVLWASGPVRGGQHAVNVHAALAGVKSIALVVTPVERTFLGSAADVADWADASFSCTR
jgi:hypothetical protein